MHVTLHLTGAYNIILDEGITWKPRGMRCWVGVVVAPKG